MILDEFGNPYITPSAPRATRELRRRASVFEAGETDRLNSAHWELARDSSVNAILGTYLTTLRARCSYEAFNNPDVAGVMSTHLDDTVGEDGPQLQVTAPKGAGKRWRQAVEDIWSELWEDPDTSGLLSGADWLKLCLRMDWICGEDLNQIVIDPDARSTIKHRVRSIHPRRLYSPWNQLGDELLVLGVKRSPLGRPTTYYVESGLDGEKLTSMRITPRPIPARDILHDYHVVEPDQARGVPWLISALNTVADLRDYCQQVMDAARSAADAGVLMYTTSPDVLGTGALAVVNDEVEIQRRMITTLPPGYQAMQINPQQPSTRYVEFVAERLRSLGRPIGMPLMTVQLDSSRHNYSSARFDGQSYQRAIKALRRHMTRRKLTVLLRTVIREAELAGALVSQRPAGVKFEWIWPAFAHVDPHKEASGIEARLATGVTTLAAECAAESRDWEAVLEQRAEEFRRHESLGLPAPAWLAGAPVQPAPGEEPVVPAGGTAGGEENGNGVGRLALMR